MKRILIFAGTTEGRELSELLSASGLETVVCVATEYGEEVMEPRPGVELHKGRMNEEQMKAFMEGEAFLAVVDATHPFALEVSKNIKSSAEHTKIPYYRLKRNTKSEFEEQEYIKFFSDNKECAKALLQTEGNILLTTGSKELPQYTDSEALTKRLYARVLPSEENLSLCKKEGLTGGQIIAMQGPFTEELNCALIHQYNIKIMVSKESGATGGFPEKKKAAEKTGIQMFVIKDPEEEEGFSFSEIVDMLGGLTDRNLSGRKSLTITLAGIGMGDGESVTEGTKNLIRRADYVFGARRLLSALSDWNMDLAGKEIYPFYLAEDILPKLERIWSGPKREAVILFSGDSGFYSGALKLYEELTEWEKEKDEDIIIRILPGISAVSYFAATCKTSWQDTKLISIHGRKTKEEWISELLFAVRYHEKVMVLVSGVKDVCGIGELLTDYGMGFLKVMVGFNLSYPDEEIMECTPRDCMEMEKEGLYILLIMNGKREKKYLAPCLKDEAFIRGKVPMTKEEIRELSICKLQLTKEAIVYDIGCGTGSIAVEMASRSESLHVYAIERKEEAIDLIKENKAKFKLPNIEIVAGDAPGCMEGLPVPTHAFIGGSSGNLKEIFAFLYKKNPSMRVVMTAISLETIGEATSILKTMPVSLPEMIQVQINRSKEAGNYHLMQSENPVYIISFNFKEGK